MVENNVESVRENDRYLEAIINRKKRTIPIASIEYVESRGRKIVLHLGCGEMTFYSKISEIEEKLVNNGFVRVHQSFMVRMADISKISRDRGSGESEVLWGVEEDGYGINIAIV
mgnify:CR=1 FL=1